MIKVFISQPMKGESDEAILKERDIAFAKAKQYLVNKGIDENSITLIDSFLTDDDVQDTNDFVIPVYYLSKSIQYLSYADYIYVDKDYKGHNGCELELEVAKRYGINVIMGD